MSAPEGIIRELAYLIRPEATPVEAERLVTWTLYPTRTYRLTQFLILPLYRWSERDSGSGRRLADWLADRLDDLGRWSNRRRADRRVQGRQR